MKRGRLIFGVSLTLGAIWLLERMRQRSVIHNGCIFPISVPRITLVFARAGGHEIYNPRNLHKGIDCAHFAGGGAEGKPVRSALGDGTVLYSAWSDSYGNYVAVEHTLNHTWYARTLTGETVAMPANVPFFLVYAHLKTRSVNTGDTLETGQQIGLLGNTGISSAPHLHFEIRRGRFWEQNVVDPEDLFHAWLVGYKSSVRYKEGAKAPKAA